MPDKIQIAARPFPFPLISELRTDNTALVIVDMQIDFCAEGGMMAAHGLDLSYVRTVIEPIRRVLDVARKTGMHIIHTRVGNAPDLSDLNAVKQARQEAFGSRVGGSGRNIDRSARYLIRGEPSWNIIPELKPNPGELIIDKPGYDAFYATDMHTQLKKRGIENLVLTGVATDCCVTSTLRQAAEHGYDCLVLADCCACMRPEPHHRTIELLEMGSMFGTVAKSETFIDHIQRLDA